MTMLKEVTKETYRRRFQSNPHPYISETFLELVLGNTEQMIRLMDEEDNSIGLILGSSDGSLSSPFSAPFGGFHYSHEYLTYEAIYSFVENLKAYVTNNNYKDINITLPPDIYQKNTNAKFVNAFIKAGYDMQTPDITNWINLKEFDGTWIYGKVGNRCRRALRNNLYFETANDNDSKQEAYTLIKNNRLGQNRSIHMSFEDLMNVESVIPVDYFVVREDNGNCVGSGIFYRGHDKIAQGIFMGDDLERRDLGAIDFLYMSLYNYYKDLDFDYVDFGTSSSDGEANTGLIRFKEIHNCHSALRFSFKWVNK